MLLATVMILLADALAGTCPARVQLGGGATIIRPVGTFEALPFLQLGPAPELPNKRGEIQQTAAPDKADPKAEAPAQPCRGPVITYT